MKKLALIGCGGIGSYHLSHFVQFKDIELAGFCDLILERAENFVKQAGSGKAFSNFIEMYDEIQPDMVFICVPPTCHGQIEFETIRRGIPFFVEKPLSLDIDLAKELVRQVEEKGLIAASGFQCRYDDINDAAKAYIKDHQILHVAASRVGGIPDAPWWNVKATSGGQLVEQTIHQMDMLRYLLDSEPDTVYSVASRGYITQEERVEDHWWTLNAMLADCGMAQLDTRNPFDWLILYAFSAEEDEFMSDRMEQVIASLFAEQPQ